MPTPVTPAPSPVAPSGRGIALLAPLSGPNAERGQAMVNAARLALDAPGAPPLDVRDTGGTAEGAAAAATQALAAGAGLIIGPLTSPEAAAVAPVARPAGVAVLAFTNDPAQAQPGVWTLGITPVQQVRRLVGAGTAQGKHRFAAALPNNQFGQSMAAALTQAAASAGVPADIRMYEPTNSGISSAIRDLSAYNSRRAPLEAKRRAALAERSAEGRRQAAELSRESVPPPPFDALLLAETGERLAWLTSFLAYYDIERPAVQVMGPALWAAPAVRGGADLNGAWYAAPDPDARASFEAAYAAKFGAAPPSLADLAFDAAAIGRVLAQEGGYSVAALCRPDGFAGVDGLLALQPDGTVRRGLALFQVDRGGPTRIEPAPNSVTAPGI
ncbi:ABC transporter substrate-binding protein [Rhodovastum atsumiense]|nr:ABC transporter substrate-binding protein [Rhodovastum atsumiense]